MGYVGYENDECVPDAGLGSYKMIETYDEDIWGLGHLGFFSFLTFSLVYMCLVFVEQDVLSRCAFRIPRLLNDTIELLGYLANMMSVRFWMNMITRLYYWQTPSNMAQ